MVAQLFRLRVALLVGAFRGGAKNALREAVLLFAGVLGAVAAAILPALFFTPAEAATVNLLLGTLIVLAVWGCAFFGYDRIVSPRQFKTVPVSAGTLAWGLLLTGLLNRGVFCLVIWEVVLAIVWGVQPLHIVGLLLLFLVVLLGARVFATLGECAAGERRVTLLRAVGWIVLLAAVPVAVLFFSMLFRRDSFGLLSDTAAGLAWSPFGAPFVLLAASQEQVPGVLLYCVPTVVLLLLLVAVWGVLVRSAFVTEFRTVDEAKHRAGLGWFERLPAQPAGVIAARELTYWARDSRYRVSLLAIPIAPVLAAVALAVAGADLRAVALVPLPVLVLLLAWAQHNAVAMDSTAIWMHVASGTRGVHDRAGRLAPVLFLGVPLVVVGSSVTAAVLGDARQLPAIFGMNMAVLLVTCGVTSVCSVLFPYPATKPGDSPFLQPQWSGSGAGVSQTVSMVFSVVLSVPVVVLAAFAVATSSFWLNILALMSGLVWGGLVLLCGVRWGARVFNQQGPELVYVTQLFD